MPPLLQRLRERKLVQWALAYLAGAWVVLQATDILGDQFAWPGALLRSITVLLAMGFFATLVIAWYHGEKGRQRVSGVEVLMLAGLLALAGAGIALLAPDAADRNAAAQWAGAAAADGVPEHASVVVLPFADLSPQRDQEYFADGLTEEILNALVRIPELRVPARTTSFSFKGKNLPVPEIARQLGVAHVLEGSIRKDGERLRIHAQLVDARGDRHLWSERYDRQLADVFAVQEEIARAVVEALQVRLARGSEAVASGESLRGLAPAAGNRLVATGTTDPAVYELYLRGLHAWNRRNPQTLRQAAGYFQHAVERDPRYARGWAGLALTYVLMPEYTDTLTSAWTPRAREAAERALALDPQLAEAHTALAQVYSLEWNHAAAEREFRRALEINPFYATAYQWYGGLLHHAGRLAEAMPYFERALELDPLSFIINANLGDLLHFRRQYEAALARYRRALELNPESGELWQAQYAVTLLVAGHDRDALREVDALLPRIDESWPLAYGMAGYVQARAGRGAEARGMAARLEARARRQHVSPVMRAYVYIGLGDHERALALLQEALEVRDANLLYYVPHDPVLDPLRDDPRFVRLAEQLRGPR